MGFLIEALRQHFAHKGTGELDISFPDSNSITIAIGGGRKLQVSLTWAISAAANFSMPDVLQAIELQDEKGKTLCQIKRGADFGYSYSSEPNTKFKQWQLRKLFQNTRFKITSRYEKDTEDPIVQKAFFCFERANLFIDLAKK